MPSLPFSPNSPAARIVARESPSWVKTEARIEISSALNVLEIAQEREDIKVTNSHGFKKPPRYQYMMIAAGSERSGIMVKTHKSSRFVLYTLENIRDCKDVVLQIVDTNSNFTSGGKCYLCEVVGRYEYNNIRCERDLTEEICRQNEEIRRQKRKIERLEKELIKERNNEQ